MTLDTTTMNKTTKMTMCALGIALYVVLSMVIKIPLFGHTSLDLGYIAFAVYCYYFGMWGAVVGTVGCMFVSLLASGWFPIEWMAGQVVIGLAVGYYCYKYRVNKFNVPFSMDRPFWECYLFITFSVFFGIAGIKTGVAYALYHMALGPKIIKGLITAGMDSFVMCFGYWFSVKVLDKRVK